MQAGFQCRRQRVQLQILIQLIELFQRQRVLLLAEGERCDGLAPYRLISLDGCWYLTGELNGHITVHPLATIHAVTVLNTTFTPLKRLSQLTTQAGFIRALPHFSCIREVLSPGPSEEEPGNTLI